MEQSHPLHGRRICSSRSKQDELFWTLIKCRKDTKQQQKNCLPSDFKQSFKAKHQKNFLDMSLLFIHPNHPHSQKRNTFVLSVCLYTSKFSPKNHLTCLSSSVPFVSQPSSSTHLPWGADTTADCEVNKRTEAFYPAVNTPVRRYKKQIFLWRMDKKKQT